MDWITLSTKCFALSSAISKTTPTLQRLVRDVREARSDVDLISRELHSLEHIVELLCDDAVSLPPAVTARSLPLLEACITIIDEIDGYVAVVNDGQIQALDKRSRWFTARHHLAALRATLEAVGTALGLALDLAGLAKPGTEPTDGTSPGPARATGMSGPVHGRTESSSTTAEASRVMAELRQLAVRWRREFQGDGLATNLQVFLGALQGFAESAGLRPAGNPDRDAQDSGIGMPDDPVAAAARRPARKPKGQDSLDSGIHVTSFDQFVDELQEMPIRAPTPPPRSGGRGSSIGSSMSPPPYSRPMSSLERGSQGLTAKFSFDDHLGPISRVSSLESAAPPPPEFRGRSTPVFSSMGAMVGSGAPGAPPSHSPSKAPGRLGRFFNHTRAAHSSSASEAPVVRAETGDASPQKLAVQGRGLGRSSSRRMSAHFMRLPPWSNGETTKEEPPEADGVFGVSLQKSINIARGTAKTHHGEGASGSSRRDLPLCVLKCYSFVKERGLQAPDIFGEGGDAERVRRLQTVFSTGPHYGSDVDWSQDLFSVHDAADLILIYLALLPKPLVPESVAKRWVSLSKQATLPGSHAVRLEQCIDFWEEAFGGIRGPARSLLKLLLNLWGDIADAADQNDMTAERLAARIVSPLMHLPSGRHHTDYMLGLAFIIRKRSEYSMLLQGNTRKSNAAF